MTDDTAPLQPERFADDARRYRLDSRIATGGMGEVWRGTDTSLDRPVAVKLLKHEYADDPTFRSRFEVEARHAAALQHPGIAAVFDVGESTASGVADGSGVPRPYLVMELVDGQPLSALLRPGEGLDPDAVRDLLAQAGDAIGAAHRAGIVHRDIKPANLLVTPDRRIKITDFGIARASEGLGLTGTGQVMGTPQYLSPEQARGEVATSASDVYSLGVVAFECLAGRRPFEAESPVATALAHIQQPVPDLPADVPDDLALVVQRALSKTPGDRYADGAAFAAALRDPATAATQIVRNAPPPVPVPPPTPTPVVLEDGYTTTYDEQDRRTAWPALLLIAGLVIAAIVIVYLLVSGSGDPDDQDVLPSESTSSEASPTESTSPTESESAQEIVLDPDDYVGRDVDEVASDLRDLGLKVDTQPVANPGGEEADTVESVSPTSGLSEGDTVTVTYYEAAEPTEEPTPSESESTTPSTDPTPSENPSKTPSETASGTPAADPTLDPTATPIAEATP